MIENLNYLFHYLEKEFITIDKSEFLFQIKSHPDYPSLLSISDTLTFFNVENGALKVKFSELDLLPNGFITLLNKVNAKPRLCYLEKKQNRFFFLEDKKQIEIIKTELEKSWSTIVLLIEKSEIERSSKKNSYAFVLPVLCMVLLFIILLISSENFATKIFIIFPVIGILFSIASLKDLFGAKSEIISNFCNISVSTSCEAIINSEKWKLFKFLNFSTLSIVFYNAQFLSMLLFMQIKNIFEFFIIQKILLLFSLPIIGISIYYQKFVEKKWCPICLVIISILILELFFIFHFFGNSYEFKFSSVLLFALIFLSVALLWSLLKPILIERKGLKEFQIKGNRFIRNYSLFKDALLNSEKIKFPENAIIIGNPKSRTEITVITNPFCVYCKDVDLMLNNILKINQSNLKIRILMSVKLDIEEEDRVILFKSLMAIYLEKGQDSFINAFSYWFENKKINEWNRKFSNRDNTMVIEQIYFEHNEWCLRNNFHTTPLIFINGYKYPKVYERENLPFFINELIEDDF